MRVCCVICGDLFLQGQDVSAAPCGHTFHTLCVIQWLERSKSCPQCRSKATEKTLKKLFFDPGTTDGEVDPAALQQQVDNLKFQLKLKEQEIKKSTDEAEKLRVQAVALREEFRTSERTIRDRDTTILALKTQMQYVGKMSDEAKKAKAEAKELKEQLKLLRGVENVLSGTTEEVTTLVNSEAGSAKGLQSLATFCAVLKKELSKAVDARSRLRSETTTATRELKEALQLVRSLKEKVDVLTTTVRHLEEDNDALEKENSSLKKKVGALEQAITSPSDDVRNSALHRLLFESPAPALLKRLHSAESCDTVTPEVVRKKPKGSSQESNEDLEEEESSNMKVVDLTSPAEKKNLKKVLSGSSRPLSDNLNILKGNGGQYGKLYAKASTSQTWKDRKLHGSEVGYDGMGGHHKADVFPKPGPLLVPLPKGKKSLYKPARTKGNVGGGKNNALTNYFKNTFED